MIKKSKMLHGHFNFYLESMLALDLFEMSMIPKLRSLNLMTYIG